MTHIQFDVILERRISLIRSVLSTKANEYAAGGDRLHNLRRAAEITHTTPKLALLGMLAKHLLSVIDIATSDKEHSDAMIDEKIGDTVNYMILLEALLKDRVETAEGPVMKPVRLEMETKKGEGK